MGTLFSSPAPGAPGDEKFDQIITPETGGLAQRTRELVAFRELLFFLAWRDVKVRYKQTALGAAWAVLQPVLAMVLFSVVFGQVARISTGGVPYPIFSYAALVPWLLFSNSVNLASVNLTINPQLISKVYFPRLFLVLSPIFASLVDFALMFVVLLFLMVGYGIAPRPVGIVLLVPWLMLAFVAVTGVSAWLAALNVRYRDVRFLVPFLLQALLFISPVVYAVSAVGEPWRTLYGLNPMASVIAGFRWALAGGPVPALLPQLISIATALLILGGGISYFYRTEHSFADVI